MAANLNPAIIIDRGDGWTDSSWNRLVPAFDLALRKTEASLKRSGVPYAVLKTAVFEAAPEQDSVTSLAGLAYSATDMKLFIEPVRANQNPAINRRAARISRVLFHESIHCIRNEYVECNSWLEVAASEGLAHIAERSHIENYCGKQVLSNIFDFELEDGPDERLKLGFESAQGNPDYTNSHAEEWYEGQVASPYVRDGDMYGAQLVYQQIMQGRAISELITLSAEEVLGT